MSRKRKGSARSNESWWMNTATYTDYVERLTEIALNVFEYKNLPDTVDARYLEMELFYKGYCVYFRDKFIGDIALSCTIGGELDIYRIPINRVAFSPNGYRAELTKQDSVLIFNNRLHTPTFPTIELFARRLTEIERAMDVNIRGQKFPVMIMSNEVQRLTMQNLMMQYDGNAPFIFTDDQLDVKNIVSLNTQSPYVSGDLESLKHNIWNEAMSYLGVENSNQDKRERMVASEVSGNVGTVEAARWTKLNARRDAFNEINRMFGNNVEVGYNSGLQTMVNQGTSIKDSVLQSLQVVEEPDVSNKKGDDDGE